MPSPGKLLLYVSLCLSVAACAIASNAFEEQASAQASQNVAASPSQLKPLSVPHLYWHFLIHQNQLDAFAATLQAQGKDGSALRNDLQQRLGFSDADYAPIRESSQRLASELRPLQQQLESLGHSSLSSAQVEALIGQRDNYIANEISFLSANLSPQNKASLEKFMVQFFAPKSLAFHPSSISPQTAGQAVNQ